MMSKGVVHLFFTWLSFFVERSQDSTAVVLSDSSSTQDIFNEPASSQDSLKKPYSEKRTSASCSETMASCKEILGSAEERGMIVLRYNLEQFMQLY